MSPGPSPEDRPAIHESTVQPSSADGYSHRTPVIAIVETVADLLDADVRQMDPLTNTIDADALNAIVEAWAADDRQVDGSIMFEYVGCVVTVESCGNVLIFNDDDLYHDTWR